MTRVFFTHLSFKSMTGKEDQEIKLSRKNSKIKNYAQWLLLKNT